MVMYSINVGLFISAAICAITGIVKFPELIRYITLTGLVLPYNNISFAHDWSGIILTILVLVHVALNWRWMVTTTRTIIKKP
jgi:hypothetical protein